MESLTAHSRGRAARAAVAAVALAVLAHASAPDRASAAKPGFHGMAVLENPYFQEMQRMSAGGVKIVRLPIYWEHVEPTPGARVWNRYDALFGQTAAAGLNVLAHLNVTPSWMNSNQSRPPLARPEHLEAWKSFVRDFSNRYGPGGIFWTINPHLPARPIIDYQLWNEPNLKFFWGGKPNPKAYTRLLLATDVGLAQGEPLARIITGGLFREPRRGTGMPATRFIDRLLRRKAARRAIDAVGLHPYAGNPRGVVTAIRAARKAMARRKSKRIPVWVTEFGWAVGGLGWKRSPVKAKPGQQAGRLAKTYALLQKKRGLKVEKAFWFSWRDFGSSREYWIYRMGLFDRAGNARPSWASYARSAGGTP